MNDISVCDTDAKPPREDPHDNDSDVPSFRIKYGHAGTTVPSVSNDDEARLDVPHDTFAPYKAGGPVTGTEGVTGLRVGHLTAPSHSFREGGGGEVTITLSRRATLSEKK